MIIPDDACENTITVRGSPRDVLVVGMVNSLTRKCNVGKQALPCNGGTVVSTQLVRSAMLTHTALP